jgi:hypothetical protein
MCERRGYARSRIGLSPKGNMQQEIAAIMKPMPAVEVDRYSDHLPIKSKCFCAKSK